MKSTFQPRVVSVQICPGHRQAMQMLPEVEAIENMGLRGDRHAHPHGSRQALFMPEEVIHNLRIRIGDVKENFTTQGLDVMNLPPGAHLEVGEALFEITKPCEPCERMDEIRLGLRQELEGQRGMLARVIRGGRVRPGDVITVHQPEPAAAG